MSEISGYKVYYGVDSGKYRFVVDVPNGDVTSYVINDVPVGTYYVAMTVYDTSNRESDYSGEVVKTVR